MSSNGFEVKDSGKREEYPSGMRRDTQEGKTDYDLIPEWFLERFAQHLMKGAAKYGENNWQLANSEAEFVRFRKSAFRHYQQWRKGDRDEDHAMAVVFNLMAAEHTRKLITNKKESKSILEEWYADQDKKFLEKMAEGIDIELFVEKIDDHMLSIPRVSWDYSAKGEKIIDIHLKWSDYEMDLEDITVDFPTLAARDETARKLAAYADKTYSDHKNKKKELSTAERIIFFVDGLLRRLYGARNVAWSIPFADDSYVELDFTWKNGTHVLVKLSTADIYDNYSKEDFLEMWARCINKDYNNQVKSHADKKKPYEFLDFIKDLSNLIVGDSHVVSWRLSKADADLIFIYIDWPNEGLTVKKAVMMSLDGCYLKYLAESMAREINTDYQKRTMNHDKSNNSL